MLAACAAKRWLARNAAGVKVLCNYWSVVQASVCTSVIFSLPALESISLSLSPLIRDDLGSLLDTLAWCPCLKVLDLAMGCFEDSEGDDDLRWPLSCASAFAKLSGLTKLALSFNEEEPCTLADVVGALVPLTGLMELSLRLPQPAVVPAALGRFKGLQSLELQAFSPCVLEAGCLDLPSLVSLSFHGCDFDEDAEELPGVNALQRLTEIEFTGEGSRFFDPRLVQLPGLQRLVLCCDLYDFDDDDDDAENSAPARLLRLPADMGLLSMSLLHLNFSGLRLAQFPPSLLQLVALEDLDLAENEFAELPGGITALSRLTELKLGRVHYPGDPLQLVEKCPLNAIALGDLSGFPALSKLSFSFCEVKLCMSMLGGAARHKSLACMCFSYANPAPECAPMVLQLSQDLRRSSVLKLAGGSECGGWADRIAQSAPALPPFYKFKAALEWCAL